ncbi:MAG: hypothetical protein IKE21_07960 [Erysipelotrichaceae bacterium]|nr:hypothetical protein [Erysipelotrichaceae bacterium]
MLKITEIRCPLGQTLDKEKIAEKLHCAPSQILSYTIEREALDAREGICHTYTVYAEVKQEERYLHRRGVSSGKREEYQLPPQRVQDVPRPVVVGFGPAGMFAGLILAECGYRPLIIERGKAVEGRAKDVERFFKEGILDPESNVQYGEGGAGTFSDGKLTTRIKNIRVQKVLAELIEAGGDPAIAYQALPHLGTDVLRDIVRKIREKILALGGEILFETRLESLKIEKGKLTGIRTSKGEIPCERVILALGHSAQETYRTLYEQGVRIVPKDFAAGVRVEHRQSLIDGVQYGTYAGHPLLPAASYRLTFHSGNGRGVYSFCMCPGGVVIPASTEEGLLAVNGMSYAARDGRNANSAILVQIPQKDFDHGHPLDGFAYQQQLEQKAWRSAYGAPLQNIRDFCAHTSSSPVIESSYPRETVLSDMHTLFPEELALSLEGAFDNFERKIPGFREEGIMVGMESRSSSPIRLPRREDGNSETLQGLYPCGEGAGYAGGIVSSATDGITQAERLIASYAKL